MAKQVGNGGVMEKNKFEFVCPKCGKKPVPNKEKSTTNWEVIEPRCPDCDVTWKLVLK